VVLGERHLHHVLLSYKHYYNATRTHLSLNKDAPFPGGVEWAGNIVCRMTRSVWESSRRHGVGRPLCYLGKRELALRSDTEKYCR
jgi:hypothetical protein